MRDFLRLKKSAGPSRPKQDRAGRGQPIAGVIAALAMFFAASSAQVQAQSGQTGSEAAPTEPAGDDAGARYEADSEGVHAALARDHIQLEVYLADVERIRNWVNILHDLAQTDPEKALAWRLPITLCQSTVLAPRCDHMTSTFAPDPAQDAGGRITGEDLRAALARDHTRLQADLADIERIRNWVNVILYDVAQTNPENASVWRLPMASCRYIVLAPRCDHMTSTFAPDPVYGAGRKAGEDMR